MTNARQSCRVALFAGYAPDCYPSACSRGGGDTHKATRRIERIYIYFFFFSSCLPFCAESDKSGMSFETLQCSCAVNIILEEKRYFISLENGELKSNVLRA